ncbi:glycoside hydrolase/deacetylase [Tilletiopsis washingtonensis]|uniref:Glycoside hydrolase/deacetylase n=1 Tax=Tilletiopsis washingtonensis TaxID=58919 RepID=A0A316ZDM3_9BASI|nr:glycoside hydrolase/deacetylase [Tilletiopsis washingtonensis]PWN99012.1 glycoside hydrolase/deacetylase [Tilletiopsis washingtonensis]
MPREVLVSIAPDADCVAGWLGSYGGEDSPNDISRGAFAAEVGLPRLLKLFKKHGITTTFFIPGHTLESFPKECEAIRDAGHEIGLHGYSHENPTAMSVEQQRAVLDKTYKQLSEFTGKPIVGSVAPWWETSKEGVEMLLEYGAPLTTHPQSHDCRMFYLRDQDYWTKIDYDKAAEEWMKPMIKGKETGLVEIPASWYLDDLPPMMFIKKAPNSHGWVTPQAVEQIWKDTFTWIYENEADDDDEVTVYPLTIHPDVAGRAHVMLMLDRFISWLKQHEGVRFVTMHEMSLAFRAKAGPPAAGAVMPKSMQGAAADA